MVRIRLRRVGLKKQPSYRIVVADKRRARDGKFIETIGFYNPRTQPDTINVKEDRALYWLSVGAQPSDSVRSILNRTGTMDRLGRLKSGEDIEALVAEALASSEEQDPVSPKTRFPAPEDAGNVAAVVTEAAETAEEVVAEAETEEAVEADSDDSDAVVAEADAGEADEEEADEEDEAPKAEADVESVEEADQAEEEAEEDVE